MRGHARYRDKSTNHRKSQESLVRHIAPALCAFGDAVRVSCEGLAHLRPDTLLLLLTHLADVRLDDFAGETAHMPIDDVFFPLSFAQKQRETPLSLYSGATNACCCWRGAWRNHDGTL